MALSAGIMIREYEEWQLEKEASQSVLVSARILTEVFCVGKINTKMNVVLWRDGGLS